MKCHKCKTEAQKGDKFCLNCGTELIALASSQTNHSFHTELPAEHAEKLIKEFKHIVRHLSMVEQVMGGASVVALLSFFLPWFENFSKTQNGFAIANINNRYYLLPLAILISLALLYFSQGAKKNAKIFLTTLQAVIGTFIVATGLGAGGFGGAFGLWLLILAGGVLTGASLYFQKNFLLKD